MSLNSFPIVPPARPFRHKLPTLSPSKVADLACPKRFDARHLSQTVPAEPWSHVLTYGSGLHKLLFELYKPSSRLPVKDRDIAALARAAFAAQTYPSREAHRREPDIKRAAQTATLYLAGDPDAAYTMQAETDERTIMGQAKGEPITLFARFDRLVIRPDEPDLVRIIDYKTGSSQAEINIPSATLTLVVAKLTLKERFPGRQPLLCYDFVDDEKGLVHREEVTVDRVRDLWIPIRDSAASIYYGGARDAVPGPHCQFCPLRSECRPVSKVDEMHMENPFAD